MDAMLGFSSDGTDNLPGNLGLWDQKLSIEFLKKNVRAFGGNSKRITLFGCSAGAAAASLLGLSPHSLQSFVQAVQMSGSAFCQWAINEATVNSTKELTKAIGCSGGAKECLKSKTIDELYDGVEKIGEVLYDLDFTRWGPRLDGDFFPLDIPALIAQAPPKPTIMGLNEEEGIVWCRLSGMLSINT